jgi:outer membrane protein assembly factor BamB
LDPTSRDARAIIAQPAVYSIDWWLQLVRPITFEYVPREFATPALDSDSGEVVALTRDRIVRGIGADGKIDWDFRTAADFEAGATVKNGIAYVPGGDGVLYALDVRSGEPQWQNDLGEPVMTPPVIEGDTVLVATEGDTLAAIATQTGKLQWRFRRENRNPGPFTIRGAASPRVRKGVVYVGFSEGSVVALGLEDGSLKWDRNLSAPGKQFADVDTTPVFDDAGQLFMASYQDGVYALNAETGDIRWHTVRAGVTSLLWKGGILFASGDQQIGALSADTGRSVWTLELGNRAGGAPVLAHGFLVIPTSAALLFVDPVTGRQRLSWNPGKGVSASPLWADSRLYVLSNLGYLYAMRLHGSGNW